MSLRKIASGFLRSHRDKVLYLIVGGWNTLVTYGLFSFFWFFFHGRLQPMAIILGAYMVGTINGFLTFRYLVFGPAGHPLVEYLKYQLVYAPLLVLNLAVLPLALKHTRLNAYLVQALFSIFAIIAGFLGNKYFTFYRSRQRRREHYSREQTTSTSIPKNDSGYAAQGNSNGPNSPTQGSLDDVQRRQSVLYDRIIDEYQSAADFYACQYARLFVQEPLLSAVTMAGKEVLDAACGSEGVTPYLLSRGARVTGLDISPRAIELYRNKFPQCRAVCKSVFETGFPDAQFDFVVMTGALHHFHPNIHKALAEICRVLRPGGMLCFCEPHSGSLPDFFRKFWYRHDRRYFEENEAAISLDSLLSSSQGRFQLTFRRYGGSIAYLPVLLSLFLRIPNGWKRFYAPPLLFLERVLTPLSTRRLSFFVLCRMQKTD